MAIAPTNLISISDAESTTGWTNDSFSLEPDIKVQGGNSVSCAQTNNGNNDAWYAGGPWNLSNLHVRLGWNTAYVAYFAPTNPVQVSIGDGSNTAYATYYTSNADYAGGWVDLVIVVNATNFPGVNLNAVTEVGVRVNTASKPRNVPANAWFDNFRAIDGLQITGTSDFNAAAVLDATNVYKVFEKIDGVLFAIGELLITSGCNFTSSNETVVFPSRYVDAALYKLSADGNSSVDISGLVLKSIGSAVVDFSSPLSSLSLVSCSFIDINQLTFTPTVTSPTFANNAFTGCGPTTQGIDATNCAWGTSGTITLTSTLTNCQINDHTSSPGVACSSLDQLDNCSFVAGTGHAVDLGTISASTSMTWNSSASGYAATDGSTGTETVLVNVASGQTLTINNEGSGLSVMNTGPGTVNVISGAVTVRVTVIANDTGLPLQDARVYLKRVSDGTTVLTGLTNASGVIEDTAYTYTGDEAIEGWARKSTTAPLYKTSLLSGTITNTGYSATALALRDDL